jgi:hypothetical protein
MSEEALTTDNEEATSDETTEEIQSPLDMSDEETEALDIEAYIDNLSGEEQSQLEEENTDTEEDTEEEDNGEDDQDQSLDVNEEEDETTIANSELDEETSVNYQEEYQRILSPFKANGKDIQVGTVDEALTLMQMGANYNKKMAALKPNLKILKMLEKNKLLDEKKLSYLIDLDKKDVKAVGKLVKDSEIDPYTLNSEDETEEYAPNDYSVSEKEVELDRVLEEIEGTPSYNTTMDIVGNQWDNESRNVLVDSPDIIKVINDHISLGIYDDITSRVEKERMLGNLSGLSDIAAYKTTGDKIQAEGGFLKYERQTSAKSNVQSKKPSNAKKAQQLNSRRKAASPTKSSPSNSKSINDYSPLEMSDEEFEKISNKYY